MDTSSADPTCSASQTAYVQVSESGGIYTYHVCLADSKHYVDSDETTLLTSSGTPAPIYTPSS